MNHLDPVGYSAQLEVHFEQPNLVKDLKYVREELITKVTQFHRAVVRHVEPGPPLLTIGVKSNGNSLRGQEAFCQLQVLAVSEFPENSPCCLQSPSLYENRVQVQKSGFCETFILYHPIGMFPDHLFDTFKLLSLKRCIKAFALKRSISNILNK